MATATSRGLPMQRPIIGAARKVPGRPPRTLSQCTVIVFTRLASAAGRRPPLGTPVFPDLGDHQARVITQPASRPGPATGACASKVT